MKNKCNINTIKTFIWFIKHLWHEIRKEYKTCMRQGYKDTKLYHHWQEEPRKSLKALEGEHKLLELMNSGMGGVRRRPEAWGKEVRSSGRISIFMLLHKVMRRELPEPRSNPSGEEVNLPLNKAFVFRSNDRLGVDSCFD